MMFHPKHGLFSLKIFKKINLKTIVWFIKAMLLLLLLLLLLLVLLLLSITVVTE